MYCNILNGNPYVYHDAHRMGRFLPIQSPSNKYEYVLYM